MIAAVLITHGHFGEEMLRTAQDVVGQQESVLALAVTSQTSPEDLGNNIDEVVKRWGPDGILILTDMLGGSPCNAALLHTQNAEVEIVTGVNLYMVISAFRHRAELPLKELAVKVGEDGRRAIVLAKEVLKRKMA